VPEASTASARAESHRIAGSPQAVLVVDDDGVCVEASLGACRLLGVGRSAVVGRLIAKLFEPDSEERFAAAWPALRAGAGEAGPFALEAPASVVEVNTRVTAGILPARHLVSLDSGTAPAADSGRPRVGLRAVREPSARECEVLELLASGATDAQIAARLDLSPATVQTHVRNAKAKLGARTRAQAVALAIQRGLIQTA
jgi:DNA-binding CsgD family transcriptional regulator